MLLNDMLNTLYFVIGPFTSPGETDHLTSTHVRLTEGIDTPPGACVGAETHRY